LTSMWKCAAVKASRALELWVVCEVHVAEAHEMKLSNLCMDAKPIFLIPKKKNTISHSPLRFFFSAIKQEP